MARQAKDGDRRAEPVLQLARASRFFGISQIATLTFTVKNFSIVGLEITEFRIRSRFSTLRVATSLGSGDSDEEAEKRFQAGWKPIYLGILPAQQVGSHGSMHPEIYYIARKETSGRLLLELRMRWLDEPDRIFIRRMTFKGPV